MSVTIDTIHSTSAENTNTVTDIDGNDYHYVTIGTQQWLVGNLKTTKYADGTAIPNLTESVYDDWFLPSKDALQLMYNELHAHGVGGFAAENYWSSSEFNADWSWMLSFQFNIANVQSKVLNRYVRACRSFIAGVGAYSLRDIGPAGGLIFYIDGAGTTYYEAAPSDQSAGKAWSNITDQEIGVSAQGTAIGTGQANTTAIIGQAGHTASAAKLCDDLSIGGWINDTTGAYCAYDNDPLNIPDYGLLYNWYAVDNAHGLAIAGWRVPSDADWDTLSTFLGGNAVAGGKLKEIGYEHWAIPNTGATDEYGFKGVPGGVRHHTDGAFSFITTAGFMIYSDDFGGISACARRLYDNSTLLNPIIVSLKKASGFSVRLMRDI